MATFRKLTDGSWGVLVSLTETITSNNNGEDDGLGPQRAPVPGSSVTVTKRSGETQNVVLGELVARTEAGFTFRLAPRAPTVRPVAPPQVGDLSGILALFERARQHLRYPAVVLSVPASGEAIRVSMAGDNARVPGSLNVTAAEEYVLGRRRWFGRVLRNGTFEQRDGSQALAARLQQFAANPAAVASEHGRLTGRCCFCSLPLTDERSTAVGYGKICADHYGLPWGQRPAEFAASVAA
jgi:Family of unknown function (DUF6011)